MLFTPKQLFCTNCGQKFTAKSISLKHVSSFICSTECLQEINNKYNRQLFGLPEPGETNENLRNK